MFEIKSLSGVRINLRTRVGVYSSECLLVSASSRLQSHPAIRNVRGSGFFVRYREVLEEIPYREENWHESRDANSPRISS